MKLALLVLAALPLAGCFDSPRTQAETVQMNRRSAISGADISHLSGSQDRASRAMRPTADELSTSAVARQ